MSNLTWKFYIVWGAKIKFPSQFIIKLISYQIVAHHKPMCLYVWNSSSHETFRVFFFTYVISNFVNAHECLWMFLSVCSNFISVHEFCEHLWIKQWTHYEVCCKVGELCEQILCAWSGAVCSKVACDVGISCVNCSTTQSLLCTIAM